MNLELSLPLIWLFIFALLSLPSLPSSLKSLSSIFPKPLRLPLTLVLFVFPIYLTISIFWSPNPLRALLTAGIFWCLTLSILTIPTLMLKKNIKIRIVKITLISAVVVSLFCWLQCILDIMNVPRDATLLCQGCTYRSFGFPHPNGFAIEPQFMGNLLLAPCFLSLCLLMKRINRERNASIQQRSILVVTIFLMTTLFLTFSRGAIYAFLLGSFALIIANLFQKHRQILWSIPIIITAFLLSLLAQGTFAQLSPTSDTFTSGISKAISQLTLGHINLGHDEGTKHQEPSSEGGADNNREATETNELASGGALRSSRAFAPWDAGAKRRHSGLAPVTTATGGENRGDTEAGSLVSTFNGYVSESTEVRVNLTNFALASWQDYKLFGSGLASSGTILYEKGFISTPKEIVQNEYATLLLELGFAGCILLAISLILLAKFALPRLKVPASTYLSCLILSYAATLFFFSGLPNALHVYLLPALFYALAKPLKNRFPAQPKHL